MVGVLNYITIRGGGVVYWVAALLYLIYNFSTKGLLFFALLAVLMGFYMLKFPMMGIKKKTAYAN